MELRRLRYFIAVAEELNFHKAAEKLHLGQSPLSRQIRKLEEEVSAELFVRNRRRVELTAAGHSLLGSARDLLGRAELATQRAQGMAAGRAGELRVGYLTSMTNERFSSALYTFRKRNPEVDFTLSDLVPAAVLTALRENTIDVGFFRGSFRDEDIVTREVWRDRFIVAMHRDHWLAKRGPVAMRTLAEETFIMVPDQGSMGLNETIRSLCLKAGFAPKRRMEANQMQAALWLVHLDFGVSIVPESLRGLGRENVIYQPLIGSPALPAYMAWRKSNHSPVLRRFRELVTSLQTKE